MSLTIYPAVDLRHGQIVRLRQGNYAAQTTYQQPLLPWVTQFAQAGATWLHLVDLDGARTGQYTLQPLLQQIHLATGLQIQTGGGVRSQAAIEQLLDAGASRVVIGSIAVRQWRQVVNWLQMFGTDRLTIALDTRQGLDGRWTLPTDGWTQDSQIDLLDLLDRYAAAGLRHILCTDIAQDGMLQGPNLALYRLLRQRAPQLDVQVSGGIRNGQDIQAAQALGCAGVVLGKALLDGHLTLKEALTCSVTA